jgi:mRNA interferase MazF
MTSYQPGDVLLVTFPFATGGHSKQRPALVIVDSGDSDVVLARITTQTQNTPFDVPLADWKSAGLLAPSIVRLHKIATIEKSLVLRRFGTLTSSDRKLIGLSLAQLLTGW